MLKRTFLLLLTFAFFTSVAHAQDVVTADDINEVAKGLYCPVCESEPLDTCGTQACIDWREEIGDQLEAGLTEEQIYNNFVARYGPGVLAEPPLTGLNLLLWLGLPVGLLVGGFFFYRYMRDLRTAGTQNVRKSPILASVNGHHKEDDYLKKIEQELGDESI